MPCSARSPLGPRLGLFALGCTALGIGVALLVAADFGPDVLTLAALGVVRRTGWSVGTASAAVSLGLLVVGVLMQRRRPLAGVLVQPVLVGLVIDATLAVLPPPGPAAARLGLAGAGFALAAAGIGVYLAAELGQSPFDSFVYGVIAAASRVGRELGLAQAYLWAQVVVALIGLALGGPMGLLTVGIIFGVGPAAAAANRAALRARPALRLRAP